MTIDLRALAEGAPGGPWQWVPSPGTGTKLRVRRSGNVVMDFARCGMQGGKARFLVDGWYLADDTECPTARYISAVDPTTILALLDRRDALRNDVLRARVALENQCYDEAFNILYLATEALWIDQEP